MFPYLAVENTEESAMYRLNRNSKIVGEEQLLTKPVRNAAAILERDIRDAFYVTQEPGGMILLKTETEQTQEEAPDILRERYRITVAADALTIFARGELGFIYGLLYISERYLGRKPFWFWMDRRPARREKVEINDTTVISERPRVRFRGWFFNDEVLMLKWKLNEHDREGWKMAFEALLRCGGNTVIPGTDKMSRENRQMASDMGLWITHHHAEPLGAEMFVRAYPEEEANYLEHPEQFHRLWEDAVIAQKDCKVIWNLCFRGQGDMPFWSNDTKGQFDTDEKRGRMISEVIRRQCDIVRRYVEQPVFCTNLYGEIMELYEKGLIELDTDVIKVYADNGYGKMVTRRRDNHTVRVPSMPDGRDGGMQGIYYHVSFYDLQAANHITMLPNSIDFVNGELSEVLKNGGGDFWIINCSNVRPHVYYLDAVRKKWFGRTVTDRTHSREFAEDYFDGNRAVAACYEAYPGAMPAYGVNADEHAGEQFYTENIRILAHQLLVDETGNCEGLYWLTGDVPYAEQVKRLCAICNDSLERLRALEAQCAQACDTLTGAAGELFNATIYLQTRLHLLGARGVVLFGEAYAAYARQEYERAFVLFGDSAACFDAADAAMRAAEYGVWERFYFNDCFADMKHTAYMIRKVMGYIRELGDNARHDAWYRKYCYAKEDREVFLLLVLDNHMTDWELYLAMKNAGGPY
ncbi:MAG: glycosyl hydrolase 115 family protein [Roseburia sp.]|nr:glycosyl hydrolase 115 family protein [Roseburia sp.]